MFVESDLSIQDFSEYFEQDKLGELYFPNGECDIQPLTRMVSRRDKVPFFVKLAELYKLVTDWRINHTEVPLDDILGIVAFGSAVKYPGTQTIESKSRKYLFLGPEITRKRVVPIQPNDADFLVLTEHDLLRERVLRPISLETYDMGTWIIKGGIHLVNRGVNQFLNGINESDTISISAVNEGVPIFYRDGFNDILSQSGITRETPRKIRWDTDNTGKLKGQIS